MFYYKKRNTPSIDDLIIYKSQKMLMKYEWINENKFISERRRWLILTTYSVLESKWEFIRYVKWYVRLTNSNILDNASEAIKRKHT